MSSQKKILLWTSPRCVSTAFERSIMEIPQAKIFHEPYSKCYYFGPEKTSLRYDDQPTEEKHTYSYVRKMLGECQPNRDFIFSKDMAYAIEGYFDEMLADELKDYQHTFLIRNPKLAVPSLYEASINKQLTGWETFDPVEAGFKQVYDLYKYVQEKLGQVSPVIIDAGDLLADPVGTMKAYCRGTGLEFHEDMLRWEPGPMPEWDTWNGWHDNALKSCGFVPQAKNQGPKKPRKSYPKEVDECINECMQVYDVLYDNRTKPIATIE